MSKKLIRTSERCYICDFGSAFEGEGQDLGGVANSVYQDTLVGSKDGRHRYVFLHPEDGKPVCTHCSEVVRNMVKSLERRGKEPEAYSWREHNHEMFKQWEEKLLAESLEGSPVQGAETKVETELETT